MSTATIDAPCAADYQALCRLALGIDDSFPVSPHDYQAEAFVKVFAEFEGGTPSTFVVMPTGTGKSILFLLIAKYVVEGMGGRVLVLVDRDNLVSQTANEATALGLDFAVEQGPRHACPHFTLANATPARLFGHTPEDPRLVIGTRQTLTGKRLKAWPSGHFDMVICDEADLSAAASYRTIFGHLAPKMLLGLSATWDRADKTPVIGPGQIYETLAFEYSMTEAVELGYLKRPVNVCLPTSVDLSALRASREDYNAEDLAKAIEPHVTELVQSVRSTLEGHRWICFTPTVASAEAVASAFRSVGVSCASVSGEDEDNDETFAAFRAGRYQGLVNCALVTRGANFPFVDTVVLMRPTKSRALFSQMVGRATRKFPGQSECYVIGFNWKTFNQKLVRPVELFAASPFTKGAAASDLDDAQRLVDSGDEPDLLSALKRAEAARKEKDRVRLEIEDRKRNVRTVKWDALGFDPEFSPPPTAATPSAWDAGATDRQVEALVRIGFKPAAVSEWTKAQASAVLGQMAKRREAGLASYKQVQLMKKLGFPDASKVTFADAPGIIDELLGSNRKVVRAG